MPPFGAISRNDIYRNFGCQEFGSSAATLTFWERALGY